MLWNCCLLRCSFCYCFVWSGLCVNCLCGFLLVVVVMSGFVCVLD